MGQCQHYWVKLKLEEDSAYSSSNRQYRVLIDVLMEDAGLCDDFGQFSYHLFNNCGHHITFTAQQSGVAVVDSADQDCLDLNEYADYTLYRKRYEGSFSLDTFATNCYHFQVYASRGAADFANIAGADTLGLPLSGWVEFISSRRHNFPRYHPELKVREACVGNEKHLKPAAVDGVENDSFNIAVVNPASFDFSNGLVTKLFRDFKKPLGKSNPLPAFNFNVSYQELNFKPTVPGLMVIPLEISEWGIDSATGWWRLMTKTYWQVPYFVSDSCDQINLEPLAFSSDTLYYSCQSATYAIPLGKEVAINSISPDGSDLKFLNANGYPVIVDRAYAPAGKLDYTDTLLIDASFFYEGLYELKLVSGTDGDLLVGICGGELLANQYLAIDMSQCPNTVGREELAANELEVYPNPVGELLRLEHPSGIVSISLYSADGQEVLNKVFSEIALYQQLKLPEFAAGLYLLKVTTRAGELSRKLQKP